MPQKTTPHSTPNSSEPASKNSTKNFPRKKSRRQKFARKIQIKKILPGGVGLAHHSDPKFAGKAIMIKGGALPGMIADVRIVRSRRDYDEAHLLHIHSVDQNYADGEVFCPHYFAPLPDETKNSDTPAHKIGCGGCKRQVLSTLRQLELKQKIVADAFSQHDTPIRPIIAAPAQKNYRNKIEFSFGKFISQRQNQHHDRQLGFHKQGEFAKIVDIDSCGLISDPANQIFSEIKKSLHDAGLSTHDAKTHEGFLRHLVFREGSHTGQLLAHLVVKTANLTDHTRVAREKRLAAARKNLDRQKSLTSFVRSDNPDLGDAVKAASCTTHTLRGPGHIFEKRIFEPSRTISTLDTTDFDTPDKPSTTDETPENSSKNSEKKSSENSPENSPENLSKNPPEKKPEIFSPKLSLTTEPLPTFFPETTELSRKISPFSFFQTNTGAAEILIQTALSLLPKITGTVRDLYCGTGSIGLSALKLGIGSRLLGIEIVPDAIADAHQNAKINKLEKISKFICDKAENLHLHFDTLDSARQQPELLIVDPPRDGLHPSLVHRLATRKKEFSAKILYISCNPVTMARDAALFATHDLPLKFVQPVDLFPQTHHVEAIGIL